ncbi:MAG: tetratricopeptide repeat protein [Paludibacter sp.]|nr:tetratricopeptide repeat protein [Paludibacter sp.]
MNAGQIHATFKSISHFLVSGQVNNAFDKLRVLVNELQIGEYSDRLEDLQQNYRFLLHYFVTGVEDPQRKSVYNKLIAKVFVLNSELREELILRNSSNYEYTQKRYYPHTKKHHSTIDLFNALKYFHSQSALLKNNEDVQVAELKRLRSNYELLIPEFFGLFWLTTVIGSQEKILFNEVLHKDYPGWIEKSVVISALTLNLWRMFDESKLMLLFDACLVDDQQVKQRALVGLCFVMAKYNRFLPFFPSIRNRLVLLADDHHIVDNFQNIIIQIIATAETEQITKKMQEEILPEVMKISPMLKDKMDADVLLNSEEWADENPDWQEMLEQSGVSDKLKELSELQLEGADVYMSTFSLLKNFPFFSEFTNWFLPFDSQYSAINELFKTEDKTLLTAFVSNNVMCNSDKYSFCLSILQMPESQRGMLKQSFKMEAEQLDEMSRDEALLTPNIAAKNISRLYIQDLFRFFKLNPQHTDFSDMFAFSLLMHKSYLFEILSSNKDFKLSIAEYYFSKNHYLQALELFEKIQHEINPTAALYQKIGYSYQLTSQFSKALEAYLKSDLIQTDDVWTVRKIALCYRLLGDFEKALEYYQQVDYLKPNQTSVLMQIGHCFVELGKFKEALAIYFKLDAFGGDDVKVWRAIAWCSFISGNIQQADYYVKKLLENEPNAHDYLNAGHVSWCQRNLNETIEFYQKSISLQQNSWELFLEAFNEDKSFLIANGIDADEIPLLLDSIASESK